MPIVKIHAPNDYARALNTDDISTLWPTGSGVRNDTVLVTMKSGQSFTVKMTLDALLDVILKATGKGE